MPLYFQCLYTYCNILDIPTTTPISTQKKRRGRPPKSAKKIIEEKSATKDLPNTENNLHKEGKLNYIL